MKKIPTRQPDLISAASAATLPGLFNKRVERTPELTAYLEFDADRGEWVGCTWRETAALVQRWQRSLAALGLVPGERVAIQLRNCLEWVCCEQAALALGLVVVPLYPNDNPGNLAYILADSGSRVLLVGQLEQWQALAPLQERFPALQQVLCLESTSGAAKTEGLSLDYVADWLQPSDEVPPSHQGAPGGLATIVYTSGTTGRPKGVMLSHHNILWNAEAQLHTVSAYHDDIFLSFLPLSHTFERTVGYYLPMMAGSCVAHARSLPQLKEDLLSVRPTVLISVPRVYEKAYAKIQSKLAAEGRLPQLLFGKAVEIGWARFLAAQGRGRVPGLVDRLWWRLLQPLVARKVLARLGGRIRLAISGAAPLPEPVARCFVGLGLTLLEGYGLTEAAPTVAGNRVEDSVPGSAGLPLPLVEVRIDDKGELLARSPGVMLGYWQRPEETRQAINRDGWLHTGDLAEMRQGRIYIRGRLKDILVMSTGEKVAAGDLERIITGDPLFEQVLVVGEGKPFLTALLVVEPEAWVEQAKALGLDPEEERSLSDDVAQRVVVELIAGLLKDHPSHAQIHRVRLLSQRWSIDNGLLTPTMKVKRGEVEQRFAAQIRELYAGHAMAA